MLFGFFFANSESKASAGGQLEHPSEVNNSRTAGTEFFDSASVNGGTLKCTAAIAIVLNATFAIVLNTLSVVLDFVCCALLALIFVLV